MSNRKKYKIHRTPRYEVTARIDGIGVRTHVMSLPENETAPPREVLSERFSRVYPNRVVRIVERR